MTDNILTKTGVENLINELTKWVPQPIHCFFDSANYDVLDTEVPENADYVIGLNGYTPVAVINHEIKSTAPTTTLTFTATARTSTANPVINRPYTSLSIASSVTASGGALYNQEVEKFNWCKVSGISRVSNTSGTSVSVPSDFQAYVIFQSKMSAILLFANKDITFEKYHNVFDYKTWFASNTFAYTSTYKLTGSVTLTLQTIPVYKPIAYTKFPEKSKYDNARLYANQYTGDIISKARLETNWYPGKDTDMQKEIWWSQFMDKCKQYVKTKTAINGNEVNFYDYWYSNFNKSVFVSPDTSHCTSITNWPPTFTSGYFELKNLNTDRCQELMINPKTSKVNALNVRYLQNCAYAFANSSIESINLYAGNAWNATNISGMFGYCVFLTHISILLIGNATQADSMFSNCLSLINAPFIDGTELTDVSDMFSFCMSLKTVPSYKFPKCINTTLMFEECTSLEYIDSLIFSDEELTCNGMFLNCTALKTVNAINAKLTKAHSVFQNCIVLKKVGSINLLNATLTTNMFNGCSSLDYLVIEKWPETGTMVTLDFSGLTAWGTTDEGKQSMIKSLDNMYEQLLVNTADQQMKFTCNLPTATLDRLKEVITAVHDSTWLTTIIGDAEITFVGV